MPKWDFGEFVIFPHLQRNHKLSWHESKHIFLFGRRTDLETRRQVQTSIPSRGRKYGVLRAKGDNGGEGTCLEQFIHFTPLWNISLGARRCNRVAQLAAGFQGLYGEHRAAGSLWTGHCCSCALKTCSSPTVASSCRTVAEELVSTRQTAVSVISRSSLFVKLGHLNFSLSLLFLL